MLNISEPQSGDSKFPVLLMYLPDKSGLFPWQAGYSGMDASEALSITGTSMRARP
jgi:hypothetical protein